MSEKIFTEEDIKKIIEKERTKIIKIIEGYYDEAPVDEVIKRIIKLKITIK